MQCKFKNAPSTMISTYCKVPCINMSLKYGHCWRHFIHKSRGFKGFSWQGNKTSFGTVFPNLNELWRINKTKNRYRMIPHNCQKLASKIHQDTAPKRGSDSRIHQLKDGPPLDFINQSSRDNFYGLMGTLV